ncbi:MAG: DUF4372 domain-containing protein [Planctomycetes bacterium]|nr:DUF4372 domain-containing protein [Planctomycetota bacterium]
MRFLPLRAFHKCVHAGDNYRVQKFTCLEQFLCMAFAQLTYREGLRDIQVCLRSVQSKLYHMGIRGGIAKSTLADANDDFLTNRFDLPALTVAQLYKAQWRIELFFTWIKQHLRIPGLYHPRQCKNRPS